MVSMFTGGTRVKKCCKLLVFIVGFYLIIHVLVHKDSFESFPKPRCEKGEERRKTISMVLPRSKDNSYEHNQAWKILTKALKNYTQFHKRKLEQLKSSNATNVRTLTWTCSRLTCSGVGDQLFRIQFFLLTAMMSDRVFIINWDWNMRRVIGFLIPNEIEWDYRNPGICTEKCSQNTYSSKSILGWTKEEMEIFGEAIFSSEKDIIVAGTLFATTMFIGNISYGDLIIKGMEKLGVFQLLQEDRKNAVHIDHQLFWYNILDSLGITSILELPQMGSGQAHVTYPWWYMSHLLMRYLFKFPASLLDQVDDLQKKLGLHQKKYLAVHLRTGFLGTPDVEPWFNRYKFQGWKFFWNEEDWDCVLEHSLKLGDELIGRGSLIYVSTDTHLVKRRIREKFANEKRFVFADLTQTHSRAHLVNCDRDPTMWLEFFLLGRAHAFVHSYSSFAINAGFVKPTPHQLHSWIIYNKGLKCLASHIGDNITCAC